MKQSKCSICSKIPDEILVDNDKGEHLPQSANKLEVLSSIGGIRKCPKCSQYYGYVYDHDVLTGAGPGYSDHFLFRISDGEAVERIKKTVASIEGSLERMYAKLREEELYPDEHVKQVEPEIKRYEGELGALTAEK
ncbi:hypothetical protein HQ524_04050 [Candidatus Uhrbacteria bacterium]|nr:hypothetical protein [Candidatus Uhrbacteria bacterium]